MMTLEILWISATCSAIGCLIGASKMFDSLKDNDKLPWRYVVFTTAAMVASWCAAEWLNHQLDHSPSEDQMVGVVSSTESHPGASGLMVLFGAPGDTTTVHTVDAVYQLAGLPSLPVGTNLVLRRSQYWGDARTRICADGTAVCGRLIGG